jgi:hypothetical protein
MHRYHQMTDSQLDGLLLLAYFPKRKEKLNLSSKDNFSHSILKRIKELELEDELGENMIPFLPTNNAISGVSLVEAFFSDIRIIKMAALKTFDENKDFIK